VSATDARVVFVTTPDVVVAERIGRTVVDENLAACANILPGIRSIYRWEGAIEDTAEVLLLVKTTAARVEALRARVIELHPYEVPEFLAVDVSSAHAPYLDWMRENTE